MSVLVDATTAEHAAGIGVVINGFLGALGETDPTALVVAGPGFATDDRRLAVQRVRLVRTRAGRLLFQRILLPLYATSGSRAQRDVSSVLMLDAYAPVFPHPALRSTCFLHDVLPLTEGEHWSALKRLVKRQGFAAIARDSVGIVTSTDYNAQMVQQLLGKPAQVARFGCGQLTDAEADGHLRDGPGRRSADVLYIGAIDARKGLLTLVEAFRTAKPELPADSRLLIAGSPRDQGSHELVERIRAVGDDRIELLGRVSRDRGLELIRGSGVLVLPSKSEGFGLPLLEALALGTPAVAADIPAVRTWAGTVLQYAPPDDVTGFAAAIVAALAAGRDRLVAGQAHAQQFRWRTFTRDLLGAALETQPR